MRVMVLIKANERYEAGAMPSKELIAAMGKFNQEIVQAGVMLDGDGLKPTSKGAAWIAPVGNELSLMARSQKQRS